MRVFGRLTFTFITFDPLIRFLWSLLHCNQLKFRHVFHISHSPYHFFLMISFFWLPSLGLTMLVTKPHISCSVSEEVHAQLHFVTFLNFWIDILHVFPPGFMWGMISYMLCFLLLLFFAVFNSYDHSNILSVNEILWLWPDCTDFHFQNWIWFRI